jgi:Phosphotransferase System HPr (HPr) Family
VIQEQIKIKNKLGIHARPATLLAQEAGKYKSEIFISKDGIEVNAKSIMGIMMIAAEQGSVLNISINGSDEKEAAVALKNIFKKIFEEE